jgi:hypothetical protein
MMRLQSAGMLRQRDLLLSFVKVRHKLKFWQPGLQLCSHALKAWAERMGSCWRDLFHEFPPRTRACRSVAQPMRL